MSESLNCWLEKVGGQVGLLGWKIDRKAIKENELKKRNKIERLQYNSSLHMRNRGSGDG